MGVEPFELTIGSPFALDQQRCRSFTCFARSAGARDNQSSNAAALLPPRLSGLLPHHKRLASIIACIAARGIFSSAKAVSSMSSAEPAKPTPATRRAQITAPASSGIDAITSGEAAVRYKKRKAASSPMLRLSSCKLAIILASPRSSALMTRLIRAALNSSCCSRPSTGLKPGTSPASSGKLPNNDWQKLWIVRICNPPPGASRTFANN